jgi:MoxR-like ATPase
VVQSSRPVEGPAEVREVYERLRGSTRRAVVGKDRVVDLRLISLPAGGHVLLTDIPGVGKTTLAKAISSSIAVDFSRRVGIVREPQETPEGYTRRAANRLGKPGMARLGEIYLHARFRDAVPAALVEEFDRLEPEVLSAIEQLKEVETVRG